MKNSYPNSKYTSTNKEVLTKIINRFPLATLISVKDNTPVISHLPLIYKNEKLLGHIDIFNPQKALLNNNQEITVIFNGLDSYISPTISNSISLPTWNYFKATIKGTVNSNSNRDELINSLIELTNKHENKSSKFTLEKDNPKLLQNLDYIAFFEIKIEDFECRLKLSQDKNFSTQTSAMKALTNNQQKNTSNLLEYLLNIK